MNYERIERTLVLVLILNLVVALVKAIFGLMAGSVSMVADSMHSGFDSVSNIIGIVAIRLARMPPDNQHPYGHGRFETFGSLIIGLMLLFSAYWIISEGFGRLVSGTIPHVTPVTIIALCATIVINIIVALYERRVGRAEKSGILLADASHTASDIFVSCTVLAGFAVSAAGYPAADPFIAFIIGVLIARMGLGIIRNAGKILADSITVDCADDVKEILASVPGVVEYHDFRCRGKPTELFADIHISVDPEISVTRGHDIAETVRKQLIEGIEGMQDVVVHVDPAGQGGGE